MALGRHPEHPSPGGGLSHATDHWNLLHDNLIIQHYDSHEVDERPLEIPIYLQDKQRGGPRSALTVVQQLLPPSASSQYLPFATEEVESLTKRPAKTHTCFTHHITPRWYDMGLVATPHSPPRY